jgi:hypothetical protein
MPGRYQITIRELMGITLITACWCAGFAVSPNIGWLFLGGAVMAGLAYVLRQPQALFLLPLVVCANWVLLVKCSAAWTAPSSAIMFRGGVVVATIAIATFTIGRTRNRFRNQTARTGVIFVAIRNGIVSGIIVGLQFGFPVLIAGLTTWLTPFPISLNSLLTMAVFFPLMSCSMLGVALGAVLGLVCDAIVAADFRDRPASCTTSELGNAG